MLASIPNWNESLIIKAKDIERSETQTVLHNP